MDKQQQHFMAGATIGTEDRGDICIRDAAENLLYRMTPTRQRPSEPLAEVLRVCEANSDAFARRDGLAMPVTPSTLAGNLLVRYAEVIKDLRKQAQALPAEQAQELLATLEQASKLSEAVGPVVAALQLPKT